MPMEKNNQIRVSRQVRPDDLRVGDFVAVLSETYEWPSIFGACDRFAPSSCRATMIPNETADPVRVEAVCVPFVFVVDPAGEHSVLDIRRIRLARVARRFGRTVFEARRTARKPGRKKKRA